ncbi:hypothetical protein TorRG33x02_347230 [Trema orientale]|uniref:Uncharacterized protein n=1 Tax=Trema orientale TaxID=63057 RepID=A0A2P5ALV1_TREOI|nr:hypothetical protein TorRG33x02_347230 [Trema orientale]
MLVLWQARVADGNAQQLDQRNRPQAAAVSRSSSSCLGHATVAREGWRDVVRSWAGDCSKFQSCFDADSGGFDPQSDAVRASARALEKYSVSHELHHNQVPGLS